MAELFTQLRGRRLTTASIYYHLPDYPAVLQSYLWQEYDKQPDLPQLSHFLEFWSNKLEAPIHSVEVVQLPEISTGLLNRFDFEISSKLFS